MVDTLPAIEVTATRINPPRAAQPNDFQPFAAPQCIVEIYPYEGGKFVLQGPGIIACSDERNLRSDVGSFSIDLAPGGPAGPSSTPSWSEIITPNSLVLIGRVRGSYRTMTMVGVVRTVSEHQIWTPGHPVRRGTKIYGEDFGYFFSSFSWMTLYFLGSTAGAALAEASAALGLPAILSDALITGTPDSVAKAWFNGENAPMAGPGGILALTTFTYQNQPITFPEVIGSLFEPLPYIIPFGTTFIQSEGTWARKFQEILQWPFYEFFVMTAPSNWHFGPVDPSGGVEFQISSLGDTVVSTPVVVGRVNPLPVIDVTGSAGGITFNGIDKTAWDQLPNYVADAAFEASRIVFSTDEVRNFFIVNPTWFRTMFGQSNSALTSFIYSFGAVADTDSIHRYGYRPEVIETAWMADLAGHHAQSGDIDVFSIVAKLTARLFSYYEPTPLMARGEATFPYRPDIIPGSVFTYFPFKGEDSWTFYVEGVAHDFRFGARAMTTLILTRGLPTAIYDDDSSDGLLTGIHMGTVQRINGVYTTNPNLKGIRPFGQTPASVMNVLGDIAEVYKTPQTR